MQTIPRVDWSSSVFQPKGMAGDGGETWCVFFRCLNNPLWSVWSWFKTKEEASKYAAEFLPKLNTQK